MLDDVPVGLPALKRADKLQKRAARVGFDWPEVDQVIDKISEEIAELKHEEENDTDKIGEELGDLLFVIVNFARWRKIDAEEALRQANNKFVRRFHSIEAALARAGKNAKPTKASSATTINRMIAMARRARGISETTLTPMNFEIMYPHSCDRTRTDFIPSPNTAWSSYVAAVNGFRNAYIQK